jgi:hypothetical protein
VTIAICVAVLVALIAGAVSGFGKRWEESFLLSGLIVPLMGSVVAGGMLSSGWGLITFCWSLLAASITWGIAAGVRHAFGKVMGPNSTRRTLARLTTVLWRNHRTRVRERGR